MHSFTVGTLVGGSTSTRCVRVWCSALHSRPDSGRAYDGQYQVMEPLQKLSLSKKSSLLSAAEGEAKMSIVGVVGEMVPEAALSAVAQSEASDERGVHG